jgi:hypothetical protein
MVCPGHSILKLKMQYSSKSNSEIVITVIKLVPSQKLVFDFKIIITLIKLVLIQTLK